MSQLCALKVELSNLGVGFFWGKLFWENHCHSLQSVCKHTAFRVIPGIFIINCNVLEVVTEHNI